MKNFYQFVLNGVKESQERIEADILSEDFYFPVVWVFVFMNQKEIFVRLHLGNLLHILSSEKLSVKKTVKSAFRNGTIKNQFLSEENAFFFG